MAVITRGDSQVQAVVEDPDGNRGLACAVEGQASFVVSGDQHLLALGAFGGISIVTPAVFLRILASEG